MTSKQTTKLWILTVMTILPGLSIWGRWDHRVCCTIPLLGIAVLAILKARRHCTNNELVFSKCCLGTAWYRDMGWDEVMG